MFEKLVKDHQALKEASAAMLAGPFPTWPWSRDPIAYRQQESRRDAVQGKGGRFADSWRASEAQIRALVAHRSDLFPEFHVRDRKGDLPDPMAYANAGTIVQRIADNGL